jgi:uncharacterized membrane protein
MDSWPTGWRFWLLVALLFLFPLALHPWWLFIVSAAAFVLLIWIVIGKRKKSE